MYIATSLAIHVSFQELHNTSDILNERITTTEMLSPKLTFLENPCGTAAYVERVPEYEERNRGTRSGQTVQCLMQYIQNLRKNLIITID